MIKDKMNLSHMYDEVDLKCNICFLKNHQEKDCPVVHYIPDREFIIKRHVFPHVQERDPEFIRKGILKYKFKLSPK